MTDDGWRDCEGTWDRLKWARRQRFATARAAAESMGMKEGTYQAYERQPDSSKHTRLDDQAAAKFGHKFRVSWIWLLTGKGSPDDQLSAAQERTVAAMSKASPEDQERVAAAVEALLRRA